MSVAVVAGGSVKLCFHENYKFTYHKELAGGVQRFRCSGKDKYGCKSFLKLFDREVLHVTPHSHEQDSDVNACAIRACVKRKASVDYTTLSSKNLNLAIIAYAKSRPQIWTNSNNENQQGQDEAWKSLSEGFALPVSELRARWEGLRQTYCETLTGSLALGVQPTWPFFPKLDKFLRDVYTKKETQLKCTESSPTNDSTMKNHKDIECIALSSDSDGETNIPSIAKQVNSSKTTTDKTPGLLQTDVRKEMRKASEAYDVSHKGPSSLGLSQKNNDHPQPGVVPVKMRKTVPSINEVKTRLLRNWSNYIALKRSESNENSPRTSGNPNTNSSVPQMFGSAPNVAPSYKSSSSGTSILKKMKRRFEKTERVPMKRKSEPVPVVKPVERKLPSGTDLTVLTLDRLNKSENSTSALSDSKVTISEEKAPKKHKKSPHKKCKKEKRKKTATQKISVMDLTESAPFPQMISEEPPKVTEPPAPPDEDIWKKWEAEAAELCKTEEEEAEEGDPEAEREVRKNFLLSLLPDMAEMTMEQRRFFKSKLMYIVCHIDQFT